MPDVDGEVKFLARDPRYEKVRPYLIAIPEGVQFDEEKHSNLITEAHAVRITDIRGNMNDFRLSECGFQVFPHASDRLEINNLEDVRAYIDETEGLLKDFFQAEQVVNWDFKIRRNEPYGTTSMDLMDPLQFNRPVVDAHNDYTWVSGPIVVKRCLMEKGFEAYLRPGYRFRIVNMWRTVRERVEDCPITWCDFRSLEPDDLVPCDRVRPDQSGESFHLFFSPGQKWYWLDSMKSTEPMLFVTYDSMAGEHARVCPHTSFVPSREASSAPPPRHSLETRNVVITKH